MFYFTDNRINNLQLILSNISTYNWSDKWDEFSGIPIEFTIDTCFKYKTAPILDFVQNRWHYSIYLSFGYIIVIFLLKYFMKNREPLSLRRPLFLWNTFLALFSIYGTVRCFPEFIDILSKKEIYDSFCNSSYFYDFRLISWYWYFVMSKVFELGDTIFVVLRKQKLYRLHWIHHIATLCFCWYACASVPSTARWMVNMNFAIHSVMYTYYALKALRFKIPRQISMSITIAQIVQMIFGFCVNAISFQYKVIGVACDISLPVASIGFSIYTLFFILFLNYFVKSYVASFFNTRAINESNNNAINAIKKDE